MTLFSFAGRNLKRSAFRSTVIVLSVAVVAATLFSVASVMGSAGAALGHGASRLGAELIVVPREDSDIIKKIFAGDSVEFKQDMQHAALEEIKIIRDVKDASPLLFLGAGEASSQFSGYYAIVGFDPKTDFTILPWLELKRNLAETEIVAGADVPYRINDIIRLFGREFSVAGRLQPTGQYFLDNSIFLPLPVVWKATGKQGRISAIVASTAAGFDNEYIRGLVLAIEDRIKSAKALVAEEITTNVRKQLSALVQAILFTAAVIWIIALIMTAVIFSMIMNERQREMGLLRAMGATKGHLFRLAMMEASSLSLLGGCAGVLAGGIFLIAFKSAISAFLHAEHVLPGPAVLLFTIILCLLLAFISGTGAALFPALRSSLMEPQEAINKGN